MLKAQLATPRKYYEHKCKTNNARMRNVVGFERLHVIAMLFLKFCRVLWKSDIYQKHVIFRKAKC